MKKTIVTIIIAACLLSLVAILALRHFRIGPSANSELYSQLFLAAQNGHPEEVEQSLQIGANIEAQYPHVSTLLLVGTYSGQIDVVKLLLQHKANIKAKDDDGQKALFQPALNDDTYQDRPYNGDTEVTKFLLSKVANVNAVDKKGSTALREAVNHHKAAIAMLLRAKGAH
jgi:ankyrin repeat protein